MGWSDSVIVLVYELWQSLDDTFFLT